MFAVCCVCVLLYTQLFEATRISNAHLEALEANFCFTAVMVVGNCGGEDLCANKLFSCVVVVKSLLLSQ